MNIIRMRNNTLFKQLIINIILPVFLALVVLVVLNYAHTKTLLKKSDEDKNYLINDEIQHLAEFQDVTLGVLELSLNSRMKELSKTIVSKYLKDSISISNADLYKLRMELGMDPNLEDIYVINKNGIVIKTTYKKDLFLNFFDFGTEHKNYLLNILRNGVFVNERFTIEDATKRLRKYTYQPTQDGNYIIELGVYSQKADDIIETIKQRLINLSAKHNRIVSIDLFISADNPFSLNKEAKISTEHMLILKDIFKTRENKTIQVNENGKSYKHNFVFMERKNTDLYRHSVIRIITDQSYQQLYLRNEVFRMLILFTIVILFLLFLVYRNTQIVTAPIELLVDSIDRITHGNLQQRADVKGSKEITKLTLHFNKMLEKIEQRAFENQQQQEEIRSQAEQLSVVNKELEKLSIVASKTVNGVAIFDKDGNLEWINSSFEKIYGFSYNEIIHNIGPNIRDFNENPDIELLVNICQRTKQSIDFETLTKTRQGKSIWIQTTLTPILDEQNNIQKLVAIDTAITTMKKVEEKLRQKNKDITDSINYAKRIQEAILPNLKDIKEIFPESFVLYKPKGIVSGDFFWYKRQLNKVMLASVDCTGHGIPGAFIGMLGNAFLNEIVSKNVAVTGGEITFPPNQVLNILREYVIRAFHKTGTDTQTKDGMDISLCIIDLENYKLQFSGAYNPLYLLRNDKIIEVKANKMPIGLFLKEKGYFTNHEIQLQPNDILYLFTDGYIDQFGGSRNKKFLSKNFKKLLVSIYHEKLDRQAEILDNTFENWKGENEQIDDVLVMSVKIPEQAPIRKINNTYSWQEKHILIAEDNSYNYQMIENILKQTKINIIRASSAEEALELFRENENFDAILIDIYTPKMNGIETLNKLREIDTQIPVIIQTAFAQSHEKDRAIEAGCDDYILKPLNPRELLSVLAKYI